jgi:hypothetical protein
MEASRELHAPAALPPVKSPRYPLDRRLGKKRNKHNILVVKPEEKRPLGRSKHRWRII